MDSYKSNACVEATCNKGCELVRHDIDNLQHGKTVPEILGLREDERQQVLKELQAIMAVYGDSCRI